MKNKDIELRDISSIQPYELNAKKHPEEQVKRIAESIKKFGWRGNPIIVDKEGVIIAGHGRRLAAISLGMDKVPVTVATDMTPEEVRAFRLSDNRASLSDIDNDILQKELIDLDFDLDGIFDKKELDFAIADLMEINTDVFETDLTTVMDEQTANTNAKVEESETKRVAIAKAIGFKDVNGADVYAVNRFMAQLQADSNLPADQAFIKFIKTVLGELESK